MNPPFSMPPEPEDWTMQVEKTARAFPYPPTPPLADSVRAALRPRRSGVPRVWLRAAVLLLIVGCGLLFVPQMRAAVIELLRIGVVRIFPPGETVAPPGVTPLASVLDLPGETTLDAARARFPYAIPLPAYPDDLGPPDKVYLPAESVLLLVWLDASGQPDLSLTLLTPDTFAGKNFPGPVDQTMVNARPAFWMEAPHLLVILDRRDDRLLAELTRLVAGHVLVWEAGGVTYRLETALALEDARRIAESLE